MAPPATTGEAIAVDLSSRVVRSSAGPIDLTRREFDLLVFLAGHPRQAFTRHQLLRQVWSGTDASTRTVDVHVRRLRANLAGLGPVVKTVHQFGYRLDDAARITVD